jgi:hypothetical protein
MTPDRTRIVYRCQTPEEARRRVARAEALVGTPFLRLPGNPPAHRVMFVASNGVKVRAEHVEMVFNDALLMDAVSNWGEDGPLYATTLDEDGPHQRECYEWALRAFAGVELPPQLRNPKAQ